MSTEKCPLLPVKEFWMDLCSKDVQPSLFVDKLGGISADDDGTGELESRRALDLLVSTPPP